MAKEKYRKVHCPLCNEKVKARVTHSTFTSRERTYLCPNLDDDGKPHSFKLKKTRWEVGEKAFTVAMLLLAANRTTAPSKEEKNNS